MKVWIAAHYMRGCGQETWSDLQLITASGLRVYVCLCKTVGGENFSFGLQILLLKYLRGKVNGLLLIVL